MASLPTGPLDRQRLLEAHGVGAHGVGAHGVGAALDALSEAADGFAARMEFGA